MPRHKEPVVVGELVARYSAEQMPVAAIETIQRDTVTDLNRGELEVRDAFRIVNLLLTISLQKLAVS